MSAERKPWLLHALHLALAAAVPLVVLLLLSCMKASASKEDLGPEVPDYMISAALNRGLIGTALGPYTVGQSLTYSTTRRIENEDTTITTASRVVNVLDVQNTSSQSRVTFQITDGTLQPDGSFATVVSESPIWLDSTATGTTVSPVTGLAVASLVSPALLQAKDSSDGGGTQRVAYYHLTETDGTLPMPAPVAARTGCEGINPCILPAHFVHFEMVLWDGNTESQKVTFDLAFSPKPPLMPFGSIFEQMSGPLVVNCQATYIQVEGQAVYVRDCMTLDDFIH